MQCASFMPRRKVNVSMESGLEDRNNTAERQRLERGHWDVSMESGLEDRNNLRWSGNGAVASPVSMESGLEDRNNSLVWDLWDSRHMGLNGVRPRRPEQSQRVFCFSRQKQIRLNGVRPRRPEQ